MINTRTRSVKAPAVLAIGFLVAGMSVTAASAGTPVAPTVDPICGPNNDVVTIPEVAGVIYADGGWVDGERTITATADEGYDLVVGADAEWTFTDVPVAACPDEEPAFSYTPTEELAYTGASTTIGGLAALAILLMTAGAALVALRARAAR